MTLITIVLLLFLVSTTLACSGYEVKGVTVTECEGKDEVVGFDNIIPELKDDCTVVVKGCILFKKQIDWANGTYSVARKGNMGMPLKFSGKEDMCKLFADSKKNPDISMVFKMFSLEQKCPVKAAKICGSPKGVSVARYKNHFKMMTGDYEGTIKGTSSSGPVCVKITMTIASKGGAAGGMMKPSMPKMG